MAREKRSRSPKGRKDDGYDSADSSSRDKRKGNSRSGKSKTGSKFEDVDLVKLGVAPPPPPPPPFPSATGSASLISGHEDISGFPAAAVGTQPAPSPSVADVESFVPAIPKSLLQLVLPGSGGGGSLVVGGMGTNLISPEFAKLTRESRRCHVTGFTHAVTKQDIISYFSMLVQDVRRHMVERNTKEPLPDTTVIDVDQVLDLSLDLSKAKPFAFVELNNADMVTELIEQCAEDKERFLFHCSKDGTTNSLLLRRPKDYVLTTRRDPFKVVIQGIASKVTDERMRDVMDSFGEIETFQRNDKFVYCEFKDCEEAKECVEDLHGQVLNGRLILAQHLTEPLRGVLLQSGIRVGDMKSDPTQGGDGNGIGGVNEESLFRDASKRDHVREVLEFTTTLNNAIIHLKDTYPHLEPQFGNNPPVFPTRILVLLNLFDEHEVTLDEDYSRLLTDISEEVEQYGRVKRLIVPRRVAPPVPPKPLPPKKFERKQRHVSVLPLQNPFAATEGETITASSSSSTGDATGAPADDDDYAAFLKEKEEEELKFQELKEAFHKAREEWNQMVQHPVHGGVGRVFVEYETIDEAAFAQASICGKLFNHRTVVTSFLFDDVLYPSVEDEEAAAEAAVEEYLKKTVGSAAADEHSISQDNTAFAAAPPPAMSTTDDLD